MTANENTDDKGTDPRIPDDEAHKLISIKKDLETEAETVETQDLPEPLSVAGSDTEVPKEIKSAEALLVEEFEKISKNRKDIKGKFFKAAVIFSGIGLAVIILIIIISVFKLDTLLFPVSAYGRIVDFNDRPLSGVSVCIQGKCVNTDNTGDYSIEGLKYGSYDFTAKLDKYRDVEENIELQKGRNKIDRSLLALGFGDINGQVAVEFNKLITENLEVSIDDLIVNLDSENRFSLKGRTIGAFTLSVRSPVYKDFSGDYRLPEGNYDLGKVILVPAVDIKFTIVDWLSNSPLSKAAAKTGSLTVETGTDGVAQFTDMEDSTDIYIDVHKDGYLDSTVKLLSADRETSEVNLLPNCELVRSGRVVYVSNRLGNKNVYSSNYDGSDERMLSDNMGDNTSPVILADGKTVAFFSTREQLKNIYNNVILIPYTANINGGNLGRLARTNYEDNGGIGDYDFFAMKRVYIKYSSEGGISKYELYFGNLDGTGASKLLEKTGGYFRSFGFANNGEFLVYSWIDDNDHNNDGFYYLKTSNSENRLIYKTAGKTGEILSVSSDRSSVLVNITDGSTYTGDLWLLGINDNNVTRLTNSTVSEQYGRFGKDQRSVFYTSSRDGKSDLFSVSTNGSVETKITSDGKVGSAFLGNDGLAFYTSEKTLYVIDTNAPVQARKVTDNILNDSYLEYYIPD